MGIQGTEVAKGASDMMLGLRERLAVGRTGRVVCQIFLLLLFCCAGMWWMGWMVGGLLLPRILTDDNFCSIVAAACIPGILGWSPNLLKALSLKL